MRHEISRVSTPGTVAFTVQGKSTRSGGACQKKKPRRLFSVEAVYEYVAGCNDVARRDA